MVDINTLLGREMVIRDLEQLLQSQV